MTKLLFGLWLGIVLTAVMFAILFCMTDSSLKERIDSINKVEYESVYCPKCGNEMKVMDMLKMVGFIEATE